MVIGGGAAGFFGAMSCKEHFPKSEVLILEKNEQVLTKVKISGGGRCNVTHACFDPKALVKNYPRGNRALLGPFNKFQPRDTIEWFRHRNVEIKAEEDGRMFPTTDSSQTIIDCFLKQIEKLNITLRRRSDVSRIVKNELGFTIYLFSDEVIEADRILIATGSSSRVFPWLKELGHEIVDPVPSLFTFQVDDQRLKELSGVTVPKVHIKILDTSLEEEGPLLITHWGLSGPAVLKLSAWGARILHEKKYEGNLQINWVPDFSQEALWEKLVELKSLYPSRYVVSEGILPKSLWKALVNAANIPSDKKYSSLSKQAMRDLMEELQRGKFALRGKGIYKQEFVTAGGVSLNDVDFQTLESKKCKGLYFAGEVLDIDGITGGFNFQNAWTTAWIAGQSIGKA